MRVGAWVCLWALLFGMAAGSKVGAQTDPDWPCVQVLVPEIAPGMIWTGPPLEEAGAGWRDDPAVRELAGELAARRTPLEEAEQRVAEFAQAQPAGARDAALTRLFAGVLATINRDRASLISGIKRFAGKQRVLSEGIAETNAALRELDAAAPPERRQELEEQRAWSMRIFDEREGSLTYLCEQPVVLEQRAFALARAIAGHLS